MSNKETSSGDKKEEWCEAFIVQQEKYSVNQREVNNESSHRKTYQTGDEVDEERKGERHH